MFKQRRSKLFAKALIIFFALTLTSPLVVYASENGEKELLTSATFSTPKSQKTPDILKVLARNVETENSEGTLFDKLAAMSVIEQECFIRNEIARLEQEKIAEQKRLAEERKLSTQFLRAGYKLVYMEPHPNQSTKKEWMPYTAITAVNTPQYRVTRQGYTGEHGIRKVGNAYLVALGGGYADYVGQKFIITFEDGKSILAMVGDFKADVHIDASRRITLKNRNLVEFIVDMDRMDSGAQYHGDYNHIFGGRVVEIIKIIE